MFNIDDFFRIYFNVPMYGTGHLFSFIVMYAEIFLLLVLFKKQHIVYKLMLTVCFIMLGKGMYEIVWKYGAENIISTSDVYVSLISGLSLIMFNFKTKILRLNKLFIASVVLQVVVFLLMWQLGWFDAFKLYYVGIGPDPHNLLWAIGKANGQFMWLSLIDRRVVRIQSTSKVTDS
jgi:hypothetical protein